MKRLMILGALMIVGYLLTSCEPSKRTEDGAEQGGVNTDMALENSDEKKDADFVVNTMEASYAEIEIAKLALERSADEQVKSLAKKLEDDHNAIIGELRTYADEKGIVVPIAETDQQRKELNQLAGKDARNFDQELCEVLMDNHKEAVNEFEQKLDKTEDPELKNWISKTLPTLKSHVEMLKAHDEKEKEG